MAVSGATVPTFSKSETPLKIGQVRRLFSKLPFRIGLLCASFRRDCSVPQGDQNALRVDLYKIPQSHPPLPDGVAFSREPADSHTRLPALKRVGTCMWLPATHGSAESI